VITSTKLRDTAFPEDLPGLPTAKYALFPKVAVQLGRFRRRWLAMCASENDLARNPFTQWAEPYLVLAPDLLDDEMAEQERLTAEKHLLLLDHYTNRRCKFYGGDRVTHGQCFPGPDLDLRCILRVQAIRQCQPRTRIT